MKRYVTIDFMRGLAIFGVVFVHIFSDLFDENSIMNNLNNIPLSFILILILILYLGCWGGMFVMISATGNMFSMYRNLERGKTPLQVAVRQIVMGLILLFFSILVEGTFQRYAFFGTLVPVWGPPDPTRIVWHSYSMTPVHCLSVAMIINGIVQGFLSRNQGYKKIKRNLWIYLILTILVIIFTQPIWNFAHSLIEGYPNGHYPSSLGLPGDYKVQMPLMGAPFYEYIGKFLLLIVAGGNTPIFPFLAASFVGNIIGLVLIDKSEQNHICLKGMLSGLIFIVVGVLVGLAFGAGLNEILPIDNSYSNITGISGGINYLWLPWFSLETGGQIIVIFLLIRLIEFRDKGANFAKHTKFIRRFGIPAFTTYAFHRFWALVPVTIISWITGINYTLDDKSLSFGFTMLNLLFVFIFIHYLLKLWEKAGYYGSLEWAMGVLAGLLMPSMPKAKSILAVTEEPAEDNINKRKKPKVKWWSLGKIDADKVFYSAEWINKQNKFTMPSKELKNESKLALKLSVLGIFIFPFAVLSLIIGKNACELEGNNKYCRSSIILSIIDLVIGLILTIILSLITLSSLGISLF
ncbi:MAG: hypothetical protein ACTSU2_03100 [Promethearchaeota archaeon]